MGLLFQIAIILNLVDLVFTWQGVSAGYARELNPLMAWALHGGFWTFFLFKNALDFGGLYFLWRLRHKNPRGVRWAISIIVVIYLAIFALHVIVLTLVGLRI